MGGVASQSEVLFLLLAVTLGQSPCPCLYCTLLAQVIDLNNREVWRRRKYRVRRGAVPGSFYFSVLDNGMCTCRHDKHKSACMCAVCLQLCCL